LGIILGMLYRATHSIWPSLTVHFILNFLSILGLGLASYLKSLQQ
jgi:membrane protease YdiL (CAAX protease family)